MKKMTARMIELSDSFKEADSFVESHLDIRGNTIPLLQQKISFVQEACKISIAYRRGDDLPLEKRLLDDYRALIAVVMDRKWR